MKLVFKVTPSSSGSAVASVSGYPPTASVVSIPPVATVPSSAPVPLSAPVPHSAPVPPMIGGSSNVHGRVSSVSVFPPAPSFGHPTSALHSNVHGHGPAYSHHHGHSYSPFGMYGSTNVTQSNDIKVRDFLNNIKYKQEGLEFDSITISERDSTLVEVDCRIIGYKKVGVDYLSETITNDLKHHPELSLVSVTDDHDHHHVHSRFN